MRVPRKKIAELIRLAARREAAPVREVDVAVVTSRQIAALNRRYLGRRGATDVLCFDLSDPDQNEISAQVVVCGELAVRQAIARGHGPQRELLLYILHGLLHLMGYDDRTKRGAARMQARQGELLSEFMGGRKRR